MMHGLKLFHFVRSFLNSVNSFIVNLDLLLILKQDILLSGDADTVHLLFIVLIFCPRSFVPQDIFKGIRCCANTNT